MQLDKIQLKEIFDSHFEKLKREKEEEQKRKEKVEKEAQEKFEKYIESFYRNVRIGLMDSATFILLFSQACVDECSYEVLTELVTLGERWLRQHKIIAAAVSVDTNIRIDLTELYRILSNNTNL